MVGAPELAHLAPEGAIVLGGEVGLDLRCRLDEREDLLVGAVEGVKGPFIDIQINMSHLPDRGALGSLPGSGATLSRKGTEDHRQPPTRCRSAQSVSYSDATRLLPPSDQHLGHATHGRAPPGFSPSAGRRAGNAASWAPRGPGKARPIVRERCRHSVPQVMEPHLRESGPCL